MVTTATSTTSALNNQASVTSTSTETNTSNNSTNINTNVNSSTDLAITKTAIGNFIAGENASYQIKVTNNGISNLDGTIEFTDTLNSAFTFVSTGSGGDGFSCTASGQTVTCTKSDNSASADTTYELQAGQIATITLNLAVNSTASGTISNTAALTNATVTTANDRVSSNNNSTVSVTVSPQQLDLVLDKSHSNSFTIGLDGTYILTVTNNGLATAKGKIQITDTLPNNLSFKSFLGSDWTCTNSSSTACVAGNTGILTFTNNNTSGLTAGASSTIELTVTVGTGTSTGTNSITNSATANLIDYPNLDPNTPDATDNDPTTVIGGADLIVSKTHTGNFTAGGTGTYTLTVTNNGSDTAASPLTLFDNLPEGLTYKSYTGSGWNCSSDLATKRTVTCIRNSSLGASNNTTVDITVDISAIAPSLVTNIVDVASNTPDPNTTNNQASDPTTITGGNIISGTVFLDANGNGTKDGGESGTANAVIYLYRDNGTTANQVDSGDDFLATADTDASGNYSFNIALADNFVLKVQTSSLPAGNVLTTDNVETASFSSSSGGSDTNNNFGHNSGTSSNKPNLLLVKRITAIDGVPVTGFEDLTTGDRAPDDNNPNWPTPNTTYLRGAISKNKDATDVTICDLVPQEMTFNSNGYALEQGIAMGLDITSLADPNNPNSLLTNILGDDRGAFYTPGTQPPAVCKNPSETIPTTPLTVTDNESGVVVVNVVKSPDRLPYATNSGSPPNSYGFIRFKAKVK
jgi:uncharacterized repeat protein (TIGR01451 family)/fimbrial isopeptide formation D2 family protein